MYYYEAIFLLELAYPSDPRYEKSVPRNFSLPFDLLCHVQKGKTLLRGSSVGVSARKAKPCRPKRDKGREKEDLFLVIALKARISEVKTTEVHVCLHT